MIRENNDCRIFNQLWVIGATVSIVFAVPAAYWRDQAPWIMGVGVLVGLVIAVVLDWKQTADWGPLFKLPHGFQSWSTYNSLMKLFVASMEPKRRTAQLESRAAV